MAVDPNVYLGGASAGAYSLLSAHVSNVIINWSEMELHWVRAGILAIIVGTDVSVAVYQRYWAETINKTSYLSHIGGFIAGFLLGIVLLRNLKWKKWEVYAWWTCLVAYFMLITVCVVVIYAPGLMSS
jgi:rhomboid-related protein 1/2/3